MSGRLAKNEEAPLSAFLAYVDSLSDCSCAERSENEQGFSLRLRPTNPHALGVILQVFGQGHYGIWFDDEADPGDDSFTDIVPIEYWVTSAVEGRVTALHGQGSDRGRHALRVQEPDGTISQSTYLHTTASKLPHPGWKKRAEVVKFEPYRP